MANGYEDEPPLDPVLENVRRKLVRRMAWSLGIMMIGLMAVLGAIVYKISFSDGATGLAGSQEPFDYAFPQGAELVSSDLDDNRILLTVRLENGEERLLLVDLKTGETISTINLK